MKSRVIIASDFNASNLAALLRNDRSAPSADVVDTPFGQPIQVLTDTSLACWTEPVDAVVVWTSPERVIAGFARALAHEPVDADAVLEEVAQFADHIRRCASRVRTVLVATWTLPPWERGFGVLDMRRGVGVRALLARMNQHLIEHLAAPLGRADEAERPNSMYVLDAARWITHGGVRAYSPKAWYLGKIPFGTEVFQAAVGDIKAALRAIAGMARKLIVLDLDETLWGGIVGEVGWQNLRLGGHDAEGEALVDFQRALKALARRGILLAVVSKNEEAVALAAFREHPEMVLRLHDLAGWRINWQDKAANVADLAAELRLGLQSVVFIDDHPAERARVRDALPEVFVPEWPADKALYRKALLELTCFDSVSLTQEDRQRTAMMVADRERTSTRATVGSVEDWLGSLKIEVTLQPLDEATLTRAAQLLNKTNQMNLTTRRMTESELLEWSRQPGHCTWTATVRDKFGDLGLTALVSISVPDTGGMILEDFLLSCRVMGRKVEETLIACVVKYAREHGATEVRALFRETAKNRPCLDFLRRSGWEEHAATQVFRWDTAEDYPAPAQVTLHTSGQLETASALT